MVNHRAFTALAGLAIALASAAAAGQEGAEARRLAEETRKVAGDLVAQIRGELTKELEFSGPLRGVIVCKYTVPEISSAMSRKTGWRVTRVALRPRNPALGSADAWEQKVLLDFERRAERGERAEVLEHGEVVVEPGGRFYRYMKALPLGPLCVSCHGAPERLTPNLKALLETEYPHDRATGYAVGQIRGAVTIKRPL
ncbi:MAG: DUF3365 domain-containing protein [Betaproteobacteria bacterium]|nr:DUF3365 domain-containing protein [Betaproteobacteria bacterium]